MALFSVIVPVFNASMYLDQCVQSVLTQTYPDLELILWDDGSTDESAAMCDAYAEKDERVHVFHAANAGVATARRQAVQHAHGEYLIFVDGDDFAFPDFLKNAHAIIEQHHPDTIVFDHIAFAAANPHACVMPYKQGCYTHEEFLKVILPAFIQNDKAEYFHPALWSKVFRRELFVKYQYPDSSVTVGEDGACTLPCIFNSEKLYLSHELGYNYRVDNVSVTRSRRIIPAIEPRLIAEHISRHIDVDVADLRAQIYRKTVHDLLTVIFSQCNASTLSETCSRILSILKDPYYSEVIRKCHFRAFSKPSLMLFALRSRLIILIAPCISLFNGGLARPLSKR